jgi:dTDP-4-dehydrorhamnose 3,5-epimerase
VVRTSWVIGEGSNFVRTMASLAGRGIAPSVVNDQIGRLSFTEDIAAAIQHLITKAAPFGTYNLSNEGAAQSWAGIAADVYELTGASREAVTGVSTEDYFRGKSVSPRPANSVLDLTKIEATGFVPATAAERLQEYLTRR